MTEKFIVTGGAGFIGCNIVKELNSRGYKDILIVDDLDSELKKKNLDGLACNSLKGISEFRKLFLAGKQDPVSTVIHMGACSSTTETDEKYLLDNNFLYTRQLCEWCLNNGVRFIYASSAATYGDGSLGYSDSDSLTPKLKPLNLYGQSKQMFDMWALENKVLSKISGLKYFNVYGPNEDHKNDMRSVVNKAFKQIRETGEISLFKSYKPEYRDGEQVRDFVYVKDAVALTLFFHDHKDISGLFNCGTGKARSWVDLAKAVFKAMNREPKIKFVEMPVQIRDKYQYHTQAEMTKVKQAGYKKEFYALEAGVLDYVCNYLTVK